MTNQRNLYYLVSSRSMDPCTMHKDITEQMRGKLLCSSCSHVLPFVREIDVKIQERRPDGTLNFVFGFGISLARMDFLHALGDEEVKRDLYLGRVLGPDGNVISGWTTFHGRRSITVRGSELLGSRECPACGRLFYSAKGEKHIDARPPDDASIFDSGNARLTVIEDLVRRIDAKKWQKLGIEKLAVRERSVDGLQ